jgi:hypothetical protein
MKGKIKLRSQKFQAKKSLKLIMTIKNLLKNILNPAIRKA